jgi:hypothetical protein
MLEADPGAGAGGSVLVVASVDGRYSLSQEIPTATGAETLVEMTEDDDSAWHGRVVDPDGKPLAGLWVRYTLHRASQTSVLLSELPVESELRELRYTPHFARARTDEAGRFVLRGIQPFHYQALADPYVWPGSGGRFLCESSEWYLRDDGIRLRPVGAEFTLVADPTLVLTASVADAASGRPVEAFEGHAHYSGHGTYAGFDGSKGRLGLCWPRWWAADEGGLVELALESPGYAPLEASVRYGIGERSASTLLRLRPLALAESARVRFEIVDASGNPLDASWWARIVDPSDSDRTIRDLSLLERAAPGRYEAAAPPGRWTIRLKPNDWLGFLDWKGEVDLREGATTTVRCAMRPHGILVIHLPEDWRDGMFSPHLTVRPVGGDGGGSSVGMRRTAREFRSATVPEGEYIVELFSGNGEGGEKRVHIRSGEESVVDFTK